MHTIIVTFTLTDMTDDRYREVCAELAPAFAELPGLLTKVWLADPPARAYGGVYLFVDRGSADAFLGSALFRTVGSYPHFTGLALRRFEVDETATRRTQPGLAVVAPDAALTVR